MKIWKVAPKWTKENPKPFYGRGGKTYKQYEHALWAYKEFKQRGLEVKFYEAEVPEPEWYELTID